MIPRSSHIDDYERTGILGQGTYGIVYKATHKATGQTVALKMIKTSGEKEGMPVTAFREIKLLKTLDHPNIVKLLSVAISDEEVAPSEPPAKRPYQPLPPTLASSSSLAGSSSSSSSSSGVPVPKIAGALSTSSSSSADPARGREVRTSMVVYMVFEYIEHDIATLIDLKKVKWSPSEIKQLLQQLLTGMSYFHHRCLIHRDIKTSNLLLSNTGELKIADLGLAREFGFPSFINMTPNVITLWYRAPEVILGATDYTQAVDMWAVGCIMAELINTRAIFTGKTELEQISQITSVLGIPTTKHWPEIVSLPDYKLLKSDQPRENRLRETVPGLSANGIDLLNRFLTYNPRRRITAEAALRHPYFTEHPLPVRRDLMPTFPECHKLKLAHHQQQQQHLAQQAAKKNSFGSSFHLPSVGEKRTSFL